MVYCPNCGKGAGTTSFGAILLLQCGGTITCDFCGKEIELKDIYKKTKEREE